MKKLLALALIATMSMTMLAGCGNEAGSGSSKDVTDVASNESATYTLTLQYEQTDAA